jgi:hypothetical protein
MTPMTVAIGSAAAGAEKCDHVRRRSGVLHRTIKHMADHRESDLLAYILGGLVLAISGAAVAIASATPPEAGASQSSSTATLHPPAPDQT